MFENILLVFNSVDCIGDATREIVVDFVELNGGRVDELEQNGSVQKKTSRRKKIEHSR